MSNRQARASCGTRGTLYFQNKHVSLYFQVNKFNCVLWVWNRKTAVVIDVVKPDLTCVTCAHPFSTIFLSPRPFIQHLYNIYRILVVEVINMSIDVYKFICQCHKHLVIPWSLQCKLVSRVGDELVCPRGNKNYTVLFPTLYIEVIQVMPPM